MCVCFCFITYITCTSLTNNLTNAFRRMYTAKRRYTLHINKSLFVINCFLSLGSNKLYKCCENRIIYESQDHVVLVWRFILIHEKLTASFKTRVPNTCVNLIVIHHVYLKTRVPNTCVNLIVIHHVYLKTNNARFW